jgi:sRNA-binding carbon storage regulator CsrA
MHVISCRVQDELLIGDETRVTVLEVGDDHVLLGITSPHQIPEYQEQVLYLSDEFPAVPDDGTEADRELIGA